MKHSMPIALALALAAAPIARAQEQAPVCMTETPITAELVAEAGRFDWRGSEARGSAPAFLIGALYYLRENEALAEGLHGDVVFVRNSAGWRAFLPMPDENVVGAYVAPSTGAVVLLTQVQTEGPGQSWTLLRSPDGLTTGECREIAFPGALNQPEWRNESMAAHDFDIRANGRGEIIATAEIERDGAERTWVFRYRSHDGGATWSAPARLSRLRNARAGLFEPVAQQSAPQALVDELAAYATAR